jgi:feruloyl esterase
MNFSNRISSELLAWESFLLHLGVLPVTLIQYYGSDAHHSYFSGGSTGGREGLVEAQKNYDLFDGLFIGYPGGGHVAVTTRGLWDSIQGEAFASNHTVSPSPRDLFTGKAVALHDAVYGKCDGIDGFVDGIIDDPRRCDFDYLTEPPACPDDIATPECFTLAQRQALKEIHIGPHNSSGQLYVGTPISAEYLTDPANPASSGFGAALFDSLMGDLFRSIVFDPPPGPTWDMMTFDWERDFETIKGNTCTQCFGDECMTHYITDELDAVTLSYPVAPDMGGFAPLKNKGGKIIQWHGWSDALVSAFTSVSLYETVMSQMGVEETKDFWKLYMVPGAGLGGGGYREPLRISSQRESGSNLKR